MRVPLDACGNPIALPHAAAPAPAAAAKPASPPTAVPAPALPKTFGDGAAAPAPEAWGGSKRDHIDPKSGAVRAEKPASGGELQPVESIPAPAAKAPSAAPKAAAPTNEDASRKAPEPSVAPLGPVVDPPPPASDDRDAPAAETSGGSVNHASVRFHTT
jgi:hypothetical protein